MGSNGLDFIHVMGQKIRFLNGRDKMITLHKPHFFLLQINIFYIEITNLKLDEHKINRKNPQKLIRKST